MGIVAMIERLPLALQIFAGVGFANTVHCLMRPSISRPLPNIPIATARDEGAEQQCQSREEEGGWIE